MTNRIKNISIILLLICCISGKSQNEIHNIDTVYNSIFSDYTKAFRESNSKLLTSILDSNYMNSMNKQLFYSYLFSIDPRYDISLYDTIRNIYIESDTIAYQGTDYLLLSYDATRRLKFKKSTPETSTSNHHNLVLDNIYHYTSSKFHHDKEENSLSSDRFGEMILKKKTNSNNWIIINYDKNDAWENMHDELMLILFDLKQISGSYCTDNILTPKLIGEYVFKALQELRYKEIYCQLGMTKQRLEDAGYLNFDSLSNKEKKEWFDLFTHKKIGLEMNAYELLANINFKNAVLSNIYDKVQYDENGEEYAIVLVEYIYEDELGFIEIECAKLENTWVIYDDINRYPESEENKSIMQSRIDNPK